MDLYPCNQLHLFFSQPTVISSPSHLSKEETAAEVDANGKKGGVEITAALSTSLKCRGGVPGAPQTRSRVRGRLSTHRDVVSGAVQGPHGHTGPTQAALIHVPGHLARQAGKAEHPTAAWHGEKHWVRLCQAAWLHAGTARPGSRGKGSMSRHSQTPQSAQQSISPVCQVHLWTEDPYCGWIVTTVGTTILRSSSERETKQDSQGKN